MCLLQSSVLSNKLILTAPSDIQQKQVLHRQALAPSPTLLQGVSELLSEIDRFSDTSKDLLDESTNSEVSLELDDNQTLRY